MLFVIFSFQCLISSNFSSFILNIGKFSPPSPHPLPPLPPTPSLLSPSLYPAEIFSLLIFGFGFVNVSLLLFSGFCFIDLYSYPYHFLFILTLGLIYSLIFSFIS